MIFDKYPYTNFHEMNDDWVIQTLREFEKRLDEFVVMNSLTYADPIGYDPQTPYQANTVVIYNATAYVSKQAVPAGLLPAADSDYWLLIFPFGDLIQTGIDAGVAEMELRINEYIAQANDQISAAINTLPSIVAAWLAAHPEVTTGVPDDSITWRKLYSEVKNVILAMYEPDATANILLDDQFEQGTLSESGVETASNYACRTGFLYFPEGIVQIRANNDFIIKVWRYELSGRLVGVSSETDIQWNAFATDAQHKYRITIAREDAEALSPSQLSVSPVFWWLWRAKLRGANDPLAALEILGTSAAVDGLQYRFELPDDYFAEAENPQSYAEAAPYLDSIINSVADGKHLIFTTDRHYRRDSHDTQMLQQYVRSNLNIDRLIFGGDVLNRLETPYLAYQVMNEYFDLNATAFGAAFLPVFGNHDINTANTPDPAATRMNIGVAAELYTRHLDGYVHFETSKYYGNVTGNNIVAIMQTIVDNKIEADPDIPETLGMTRDEIVHALLEYNKLHYYVDDDINKTRYIVYNTGAPDNNVVEAILGAPGGQTEIYLQIDWLYETLISTPEGYDIIISGHLVTLDPKLAYSNFLNSTYQFDIVAQLSCLKLKAAMNTSITTDMISRINQDWTPTARRTLDFTGAPNVGKIVVLAGHWHRDYAVKSYFFQAPSGAGGNYAPADYKSVLISPGATINESSGEILIVGTAADKDMTDQQIQMTGVDAVAIDIVTLGDEIVEFKRIGHSLSYSAGNDPGTHTNPITRTFTIS